MSPALLHLTAALLDLASNEFSNHTCNGFRIPQGLGITDADLQALADLADMDNFGVTTPKGLAKVRADHPDDVTTVESLKDSPADWVLMQALAHGLRIVAAAQTKEIKALAAAPETK